MSIKKIGFFSILIGSAFIINNLITSIFSLEQKKQLLVESRTELDRVKHENYELKANIDIAKNPQFVEEEARNKLFLAKPGESIVFIPTESIKSDSRVKQVQKDTRPNWQKWWELFF